MPDAIDEVINSLKKHQRRGRLAEAGKLSSYLRSNWTELTPEQYTIVMHREASLHALNKRARQARMCFDESIKTATDVVNRARTRRDMANFVLLNDANIDEARKILGKALKDLKDPEAREILDKDRLRVEMEVSKSFLARVRLVEDPSDTEAHAELRALNVLLAESGDLTYQLATLGWIIDTYIIKPEHEAEDRRIRKEYIKTAVQVAREVHNAEKLREYQALLIGGTSLRTTYVISRQTAGFGLNTAKAIASRLL